jgi:hypothetical protein
MALVTKIGAITCNINHAFLVVLTRFCMDKQTWSITWKKSECKMSAGKSD